MCTTTELVVGYPYLPKRLKYIQKLTGPKIFNSFHLDEVHERSISVSLMDFQTSLSCAKLRTSLVERCLNIVKFVNTFSLFVWSKIGQVLFCCQYSRDCGWPRRPWPNAGRKKEKKRSKISFFPVKRLNLSKYFFLHISSSYAKILGEKNFHTREFPWSGSIAEDGGKKRKREKKKTEWW